MAELISDYTFPFFRATRDEAKPNVLLLFTDEQRFDTIHALGAEHMLTPHLDRLVNEGCTFTRACTPNPVCVAARHSLLTGLYSREHGMATNNSAVIDPSIPRLPQMLADDGYQCEEVGKMHFCPARTHHGFHRMQLQEELYRHIEDDDYAMYLRAVGLGTIKHVHGIRNPLYWQPQRSLLPEEHHPVTWVGDRACDALRRLRHRPFFLWSSWIAPHPPLALPDRYAELYAGADIPAPTPREEHPNPRLAAARRECDYEDPAKTRRMRELYYGAISMVDTQIGRVLAQLEEIGQLDNTLIIFTSDHGEMLGDNGAWSKCLPNDQAVRIPMIIRYPRRFAPGTRREDYSDLTDLLPTILDVCGIPYTAARELPGESLGLAPGTGLKDRSVHYMEHERNAGRVISLRGARYKFNYWFADGREELYDLRADPAETRNLLQTAMDADAQAAHALLKATLTSYEAHYGWPGGVHDGKLHPSPVAAGPIWPPCVAGLDWQMPMHVFNQLPENATPYQTDAVEVIEATRKEPVLQLERLNWEFYLSSGGDVELVEKIRRQ